jgi:hypothetical protein
VFPATQPRRSLIPGVEKARGVTIQRQMPTLGQMESLDYIFYATGFIAVHHLLKVSSFSERFCV